LCFVFLRITTAPALGRSRFHPRFLFAKRNEPMTQQELDQAVATATGEDVREIRRRGFSIAGERDFEYDPEPFDGGLLDGYETPQVIDWGEYDLQRNVPVFAD